MNVVCVTCTYGRHTCLERVVKCFIDQDYSGNHTLLIYNSSEYKDVLDPNIELPGNKKIVLVNNKFDPETGELFNNVGSKYMAAVNYAATIDSFDIFTSFDDDDIFLPNHISEGVKGMIKAEKLGKKAYKPYYSYYRTSESINKVYNTLEPSIFVSFKHIKETGFAKVSVEYHQQWLDILTAKDEILVDPEGKSTFIYNWVGEVFKMSGDPNNPENFLNHAKNSCDFGDSIITPNTDNSYYYNLVL